MRLLAIVALALAGQQPNSIKTSGSMYAPLWLYNGTWQVTRKPQPTGAKPETLSNECALVGRFFACQQTVNGKSGGLLVFIPTDKPGHFYTQTIMPEGRATGRDDLQISGDTWTYSSRRDEGGRTTFFRTTNTFTGKNHIHFEQAQSTNGTDWVIQNSGDEVRVGAAK
ncbi:MAG: hypothetical protein JOZ62_17980 [Acidobacteriaceae bacterium]|nr:hypothetical protein [Acidobacteriaceae bacterium]